MTWRSAVGASAALVAIALAVRAWRRRHVADGDVHFLIAAQLAAGLTALAVLSIVLKA